MKRLTFKAKILGGVRYCIQGEKCLKVQLFPSFCAGEAIDRLAEYENLEMTPDELVIVVDTYKRLMAALLGDDEQGGT